MAERLRGHEWFKLRDQILKRDDGMCRNCGETTNLNVHHIVPIHTRGTNRSDNLITLCRDCHRAAHGHRRGTNKDSPTPTTSRNIFPMRIVLDIYNTVHHPLSLAIIATIAKTGIGVGELCNLNVSDII
ncbi:HNH endonuclease [Natronococcus wangiae]|uniref:HNH endonuclease n=1 Tax=Natronococcus wangiae TaxID=3068275 RepID=UPI00387EAE15